MKQIVLAFIILTSTAKCFAINTDSLVYQQQRDKINSMLQTRSEKYSQYTESLDMHTGIFGLQTKKDIKRSNDILMQIVQTDDAIFKELKILLDYKTFAQAQAVNQSQDSESHILGYMNTINKLRQQNEMLQQQQVEVTKGFRERQKAHMVVIVLLILLSVFLLARKRQTTTAD